MNMQITEVKIRPANEALVKAYVSIVFDNCFKIEDIRVIKGPTGLFISIAAQNPKRNFSSKKGLTEQFSLARVF
jgi:stage V sporulation protein G